MRLRKSKVTYEVGYESVSSSAASTAGFSVTRRYGARRKLHPVQRIDGFAAGWRSGRGRLIRQPMGQQFGLRGVLLVSQVVLSLVLLVGALLFVPLSGCSFFPDARDSERLVP